MDQIATQHLLPMMSSTQTGNFTQLLNAGVRFFDIRPVLVDKDKTLHDYHGGIGPIIEEQLNQIKNFVIL